MKLHLLLSVVSVFAVFHLCKAGPLRHLQKRAAFYIANETACVVDNIVYSNGDPIPTDDPCEACRCRPPGFACVLKECKIKPGCRAIRHVGQCCPEYICGCEHNGRFYKDGDEIRDSKNPCYECHCQGSSIACAFVDCIYRDECDSVFVPGECCPQYTNCTRDIPDRNLFLGGNGFAPVNLLPTFNDDSISPEVSSTEYIELAKNPINPTPQESNDNAEKAFSTESSELEDVPSESETVEPESPVIEEKSTEIEEKDNKPLESSKENQDLPQEQDGKETVEPIEETKILLNSESNINNDEAPESLKLQDLKTSTEVITEPSQTTVESKSEETVSEVTESSKSEIEVTEKPSETETTSTEFKEKDPQIKNSASENSKSLKLNDNDQLEEPEKDQQNVKPDTKTDEETNTKLVSESISVLPTDDLKESTTMESKLQSDEIVPEESQTDPQATPININNAKIKSESAETVTIVVHVKESSKIPTETDYITETGISESATNAPEKNVLKSNDDVVTVNSKKESAEAKDNISTDANFEIFPTSKQTDEIELASKSPSVDQSSEDIQGRSDEDDNIALEAEENPVSEEQVPDSKTEKDASITTTMDDTEINKEVRTDEEIAEETKVDELTSTIIKTDSSRPITVEIITDSASSPKLEKPTTELENEKTEDVTEEIESKNEQTEDSTEEKESKIEKTEEILEAAAPEVREDATAKPEEKIEETTPIQSVEISTIKEEKSTQAEKLESTTEKGVSIQEEITKDSIPINKDEEPEIRTSDETEKNEEVNPENVEVKTEEKKSETTTELQNQEIDESKQTTSSDNQ